MPAVPFHEIEAAEKRIAPFVRQTPLIPFDYLRAKTGREILLKAETLQRTGSFKARGAANCIIANLAQAKKAGVVTASAGNHAQAVAMISRELGIRATIVMPRITPPIKVQNTQRYGADVVLHGETYDDAYDHAQRLSTERGFLYVHPFNDPHIMAGQGTIALELHRDPLFASCEAVVIPIGGGGVAAGIAAGLAHLRPNVKIYGVQPKNAPAMTNSVKAGKLTLEGIRYTIAEGTAMKRPLPNMLEHLVECLDDVFLLSEESIASAIALLAEHGKFVVEGSGALGLAAVMEGMIPESHVTILLTGGNIDVPTLSTVLQRGLVAQGRRVGLVIRISDRPGGLNAITQVLAEEGANIVQCFHQRWSPQAQMGEAALEVELETRGAEHTEAMIKALSDKGFIVHRV